MNIKQASDTRMQVRAKGRTRSSGREGHWLDTESGCDLCDTKHFGSWNGTFFIGISDGTHGCETKKRYVVLTPFATGMWICRNLEMICLEIAPLRNRRTSIRVAAKSHLQHSQPATEASHAGSQAGGRQTASNDANETIPWRLARESGWKKLEWSDNRVGTVCTVF